MALYAVLSVLGVSFASGSSLPEMGPYSVQLEELVYIGGMISSVGWDSQLAFIYYPSGTANASLSTNKSTNMDANMTAAEWIKAKAGTFPIISFNHGIMSGGSKNQAEYSDVVKIIASWGFFVVAMDGCSTALCEVGPYSVDQLNVIERFAKGEVSKSKYPFVALADPWNAGIAGHSYGGMATVISARGHSSNVKAAFALHPCPCFEGNPPQGCPPRFEINIPIYYVTGTLDTICLPAAVKNDYDRTAGGPSKGFAEMEGITHLEPMNPPIGPSYKRWAPYIGQFFRCHILADSKACDLVYGSGSDALCQAYKFSSCEHAGR